MRPAIINYFHCKCDTPTPPTNCLVCILSQFIEMILQFPVKNHIGHSVHHCIVFEFGWMVYHVERYHRLNNIWNEWCITASPYLQTSFYIGRWCRYRLLLTTSTLVQEIGVTWLCFSKSVNCGFCQMKGWEPYTKTVRYECYKNKRRIPGPPISDIYWITLQ